MIHPFARSVAWLGISRIVIEGYTFVFIIYVASLLSPSDYALFGIAMLMIGFLDLITEFGLGEAVVQRKNVSDEEIGTIFWCTVFMGLAVSLSCITLSHSAEAFFEKPGVASIIKVLSLVLLLKSCSITPYKLLERKMRFQIKAKIDMASKFLSITSAAILAYSGYGVWSLVYGQVIHSISITLLSFSFEPVNPRLIVPFRKISDVMIFGLNIMGLRFTWYMNRNLDKVIGGKFLKAMDFGHYSFAFKLVKNLQQIIQYVISVVSLPLIAKVQDNDEQVNNRYLLFVRYTALFTFPIFIGLLILSDEIIRVIFAQKWIPIIPIFRVACFVTIPIMINSINETLFIASGKPHIPLYVNIFVAIILAASFLFSVQWGTRGLLFTWMLLYPILFTARTTFTLWYRKIKIPLYLGNFKPAFCGSVAMLIAIYLFRSLIQAKLQLISGLPIISLLADVIVGGLAYIAVAILLDPAIITFVSARPKRRERQVVKRANLC